MVQLLDRHHHLFRWLAEFSLMPLHFLAAYGHQYGAATVIGSAVMIVYAASSVRHLRVHGV